MECQPLLNAIVHGYRQILKDNLVGIYLHGSIAFGCFRWDQSDVDFLVVVKTPLGQAEKEALVQLLLDLEAETPKKGVEMSVVLEEHCRNFCYPTPYHLHFSNDHLKASRKDLAAYCASMNGLDKDLAAHFTVTRAVGIALWGEEIASLFGPVPREDYLDSLLYDVGHADEVVMENPVYFVLNLCRVLAFLREDRVLSKAEGGRWGLEHLPKAHQATVQAALDSYTKGVDCAISSAQAGRFAVELLTEIYQLVPKLQK